MITYKWFGCCEIVELWLGENDGRQLFFGKGATPSKDALGYAIFTQGETLEELRQMVRDAVNCHFEKENKPRLIRLHMLKDEVIVT